MIVLYKSIYCSLNINTKLMINIIVRKTWISQFFILYNNINVYKHTHNHRIYNQSTLLNYATSYIYFIKTFKSINNNDNI